MGWSSHLRPDGIIIDDARSDETISGTEVTEGVAHMGLPAALRVPPGILEFSRVVIYVIPATSIIGAILLTGYIGGAIVTHLRISKPVSMQIVLGLLIWLGLYLRERRLKALIPIRTSATQRDGPSCAH